MRSRSHSVALPSRSPSTTTPTKNRSSSVAIKGSSTTTSASRSLLNLPGELKLHYPEVVSVAEKLTRLFSRSHSYNVHKHHKSLALTRPQRNDSWVTVHNLKQLDGGILDPDDRLSDVADDREQIIALYEEQTHHHHIGDGTSASSDSENPSPDIFQDIEHKFSPFTRNDIEITGEELSGTPPPLHVRRGSEPALNRLSPIPPVNTPPDPTKRWSAAPIIEDQAPPPSSTPMKTIDGHSSYEDDNVFVVDPGERGEGSGEEKTPSSSTSSHHSATTNTTFTRFSRDTNRCSVQVLSDNPSMARWADAADNALVAVAGSGFEGRRREPLGGSASSPMHSRDPSHDESTSIVVVILSNDRGPLGIHVIPSTDGRGRDQGLLVEGVEPGGRIARDGRIHVHDTIVEINGRQLSNISFQKAQEIFKDAMMTPELRLRVVKRTSLTHQHHRQGSSELVEAEERLVGGGKIASVSSTRRVAGSGLSSRTQAVIMQSNTRKLGRRLRLNLTKGAHGLGFSITTRDNPAGGEAPIYIKNILPKGAAIEDGTLRIGDRLLEVNGVEVTGRSQSEVAGLLRQIPVGGAARLTVSRQDQRNTPGRDATGGTVEQMDEMDKPPSPKLPRQLQVSERATEDSLMFPWRQREILMFEIPVHDSERAGLGVSVKGKTSSGPNGSVDLGIFVKNVIHGGAASRDGRLLQNDQLVNINGLSLLGKPNSEAMKTLRTAMHQESPWQGPNPGMISLTVARRMDQGGRAERSSPSSANCSGRESANSLLTNSSGTETLGGAKSAPTTPTPDHYSGGHSDTATMLFGSNKDERYDGDRGEFLDVDQFDVRNPVIHRLTTNNGALRNESYYKATHDTWNASQLQHLVMRGERESLGPAGGSCRDGGTGGGGSGSGLVVVGGGSASHHHHNSPPPAPPPHTLGSPTVNLPSRDTLIIHDDPSTTLHLMPGPLRDRESHGASIGGSLSDHPSHSDDAYTSQTSLEENDAGFSRDQFGRQSMSEKRHATLDAKNTDTYQRNKKAREEREKQKQIMLAQEKMAVGQGLGAAGMADALRSRLDYGPGLGMKKSSSLESLQTMVQEIALEEEGQRVGGSGRVPRGRGCNESFRAAVDRSYDVPLNALGDKMETLAEEESESSGSGFGRGNSRQSSVHSAAAQDARLARGPPPKPGRKKPGLFKGLGSMFRFGKHRKSGDNLKEGDSRGGSTSSGGEIDPAEVERLAAARRLQQEEHDHMQEQYRRLIESTAARSQGSGLRGSGGAGGGGGGGVMILDDGSEPSRSERMHQLRAEHQRRHAQRNRTYPTDDSEERYESAIRQRLDPVPSEPKPPEPRHVRSHSYDLYGSEGSGGGGGSVGMGRPGSRMAYADPHKYSHYVNYEQIQQHLRKNKEQERLKKLASQQYQDFRDKQTSRESREYQSQRGPRDSSHHPRPVSNYYEYESVQAMISHARDPSSSTSLPRPRHPHPAPPPPPPPPPPQHHPPHPPTAMLKSNLGGSSNNNNNNNTNNNHSTSPLYPGSTQPHHLTLYKQSSTSSHPSYPSTSDNDSYQQQQQQQPPHSYHRPNNNYPPPPHHHHHHKAPPPPPHHHHTTKITVPGSKV